MPSSSLSMSAQEPEKTLFRDFMASVVVCLVALPLCMGIAIASGVPPALGLITGIVGGLVVGRIAGSPLQVSGPAAGLAVMVWEVVQTYGIAGMGLAVLIAGVLQLAAGSLGLGRWFRAVSPAVIQGMLAGIGVLILASQFHVMVDAKPLGSGISNLLDIPQAIFAALFPVDGSVHHMAAGIGLFTIFAIVAWNKFRPRALRALPGPLVGVTLATAAAALLSWPIARVSVPDNLTNAFTLVGRDGLFHLGNVAFWGTAIGLALIASAETLLCATAVDRMHNGERTDYDRELRAQGVGNILCGAVGALPMTGVIVRSSANVEAGARTRLSAILHGAWLLILVVLLPGVLEAIPTASLAAVLVYTGFKLVNIDAAKKLYAKGRAELGIWAATLAFIVATDLLTGVLIGFGLALVRLLFAFCRIEVRVENHDGRYDVYLRGAATFMSLPRLAAAIESIPKHALEVHVHIGDLAYVDHACLELLEDWHRRQSGKVVLELDNLKSRSRDRVLVAA